MEDIGLINSHGTLDEGRFFFLPKEITLYCIAPVSDYCTLVDFEKLLSSADTAEAAMEMLPRDQKYRYGGYGHDQSKIKYQRAAVPDVSLSFYEGHTKDNVYNVFGVFPSLMVPQLLRVPDENKNMHTCMTSQTDCREEVYEAIGDVRNRLNIGKDCTLSEVIQKVSKMDKYPKKIILLACRSCESSELCAKTQWMADYLNEVTSVWDEHAWKAFETGVDEDGNKYVDKHGSFDYNALFMNEFDYNDTGFMRKKEKQKKKKLGRLTRSKEPEAERGGNRGSGFANAPGDDDFGFSIKSLHLAARK